MTTQDENIRYVIVLQPKRRADGPRALRWLLKRALRDHDLKCVDARQVDEHQWSELTDIMKR